ncbi:MAG TPA: hypothetical protein VFN67_33700, partial [Polyangiales bacterium]|nr:hypothetical protein [Polyangiales bacterium]
MSINRKLCVWAWLAIAACAAPGRPAASTTVTGDGHAAGSSDDLAAEPWGEATARFRVQPNWLGADSAYSIELDATHVLWLFADTFIDPAADGSRENGPNFFIRNSVAIQSGQDGDDSHDLSRSELQFYWGPNQATVEGQVSAPSSFFRDIDGSE